MNLNLLIPQGSGDLVNIEGSIVPLGADKVAKYSKVFSKFLL